MDDTVKAMAVIELLLWVGIALHRFGAENIAFLVTVMAVIITAICLLSALGEILEE